MPGNFTGEGTDSGDETTPGVNAPASAVSGAAWTARTDSSLDAGFGIPTQNYLWFGGFNSGGQAYLQILTASQAFNIDSKIDDGLPHNGSVFGSDDNGGEDACVTASPGTATTPYNLDNSDVSCLLEMKILKY